MILGIDEVGRGPWAGPLVVGAVILDAKPIEGLDDSKKLTKKRRELLDVEIRDKAAVWALGWVSAHELDTLGMSEALRQGTRRAVQEIQARCKEKNLSFDEIIIDGTVNFLSGTALEKYTTTMAKADGLIPSVSAASIIAKVARDRYMAEQDEKYPGYGFATNAGYGVAKHRVAIDQIGVCPEHRLSFAPLAKYQNSAPPMTSSSKTIKAATTKSIGDAAESIVAENLTTLGHEVIARNWRTKWCEIDIISRKEQTLFFTEVKYRKNAAHGDGLAAITPKKLKQMHFAARLFLAKNQKFADFQPQLLAVSVIGDPPQICEIVEID